MEVTVSEMKAIEKQADACGLSYTQMMENAGSGAAAVLLEQGPRPLKTAGVLCGTGNNGGDGFVLGRALAGAGVQVRFYLIGGQPKTPDADLNFHRVQALSLPVVKPPFSQVEENWLLQADVLVDALCGTGFHGSLRPEARAAARLLQKAQRFVL